MLKIIARGSKGEGSFRNPLSCYAVSDASDGTNLDDD
jgi:hypothetical protein